MGISYHVDQAAQILGPFGDGTNPSNLRRWAVTTSATYFAVPTDWLGKYVTVKPLGADIYWFWSGQNSTLPDASTAAGATGDKQLGWRQRDGEVEEFLVPTLPDGVATIYFCVDASASGDVWIRKSSN